MLAIGNHCEFCGARDFLPFTCSKCKKSFCGTHREVHNCKPLTRPAQTKRPPPLRPTPQTAASVRQPNTNSATKSSSAAPAPASASKSSEQSKQSALNKLRSLIGGKNTPGGASRPPPTKSALTELKAAASGDLKIPQARRVYLRIQRPARKYKDPLTNKDQVQPAKTITVFYDGEFKVGRVIDLAGVNLGFKGTTLKTTDGVSLDASGPISDYSGQTLLLE